MTKKKTGDELDLRHARGIIRDVIRCLMVHPVVAAAIRDIPDNAFRPMMGNLERHIITKLRWHRHWADRRDRRKTP